MLLRDLFGFKEHTGLKGSLEIQLFDEHGRLKEVRRKDNLIVNGGFDFISDAIGLSASRPAVMAAIAVGTGSTAAAGGDTALGTELTRAAATYAHTGGTKVFTFSNTFGAGVATGALTEAAVLNNASSGGIMLDRVVFSVINKGSLDTVTFTFTFTMS